MTRFFLFLNDAMLSVESEFWINIRSRFDEILFFK